MPHAEMSRAQAQDYRARWELVARAELAELRRTPLATKLRQLSALMASVDSLGWSEILAAEDEEERKRWNRLRQVLSA